MTTDSSGGCIDGNRTVPLDDVGGGDLLAATLVGVDFTALAILDTALIPFGVPIDAHCRSVPHEQLGPLPLEFVRRITITQRKDQP
jgi:hypothetical protein